MTKKLPMSMRTQPEGLAITDEASWRLGLRETFEDQAEWRREKAKQYPDDERNLAAAAIYDRLAATVDAIPGDVFVVFSENVTEDFRDAERLSEMLRDVGFNSAPETAEDFVRSFIADRTVRQTSLPSATSPTGEATERGETAHERFMRKISGDPQFRPAKPSGTAFVIGGAKPYGATGSRSELGAWTAMAKVIDLDAEEIRKMRCQRAQALDAEDHGTSSPNKVLRKGYDSSRYWHTHPTGNTAALAIRRLRKDRPDIHARVLAGELSAHAGMVEAGFRKKPPSRTALQKIFTLLDKLTPAERAEVRRRCVARQG
jgi:hypothetical protein